jgi:hypothetical protein
MKATELRIGNWVLDGHDYERVNYRMIEMIVKNEAEFDPIKLTEEILLKSCVRQDVKKFLFKVLDGYNWVEERNGEYLWFINRFDFHLKAPLKYVHQLQNLYFALTGEELNVEL